MATRSIVTSQPDVACDVCERRLLRGEQSDVFLAAGERRTVCELCAPRATHEGWLRESDHDAVSLPPLRTRRGRSLFDRLRQVGRTNAGAADAAIAIAPADATIARAPADATIARAPADATIARAPADDAERYEFLDGPVGQADGSLAASQPPAPSSRASVFAGDDEPENASAPWPNGGRAERAVELFNAGEHPRRISGLARSLGAPDVTVRPDEDVKHLVSVVIAWELCWYRYGVDVDDGDAEVRVLAHGTELDELPHEDRAANAVADEVGALSLSGA